MTIGIYALSWEEQDLIYIGQSVNIESRFKKHLRLLCFNNHFNHRVQTTYKLYGKPVLFILEICLEDELNYKEYYWFKEFNNTLNIAVPGEPGGGKSWRNSNAKYSKIKLLRVFSRLVSGKLSFSEIAIKEQVSKSLLDHILSGDNHTWIKDSYPDEFIKAKEYATNRKQFNDRGGRPIIGSTRIIYLINSDLNKLEKINNICEFCRTNNLHQSAISLLIKRQRQSHKGWKLYTP